MKINKNEYENIEIPEQLDSVVQDAIDEGLQKRGIWRTSSVWKCIISVAAAACLIVVVLLNTSPLFAETIKDVPVVGPLCQIFTFRSYEYEDESKYINVKVPQIDNTGHSDLERKVNREIAKMINREVADSKQKAEEDYEAYILTGGDPADFVPYNIVIDYEIKCTDEHFLSFAISKDETRASGYFKMFYYNIDLDTGNELTLRDLFGSDYKRILSEEVQKQLNQWDEEQKFYLWDNLNLEELFNDNTQFYINEDEQVVLFFNKYELGAGAMGTPEFTIDRR